MLFRSALSFVDMPNAYVRFFGEEGLNDEGFSLSFLLPNHAFFQELTLELTNGPRDNPSFFRSDKNNLNVFEFRGAFVRVNEIKV